MPLRDHFRSPVADRHSWDEVHGGWPMVIVQGLARRLPKRYTAAPQVHLGAFAQVDVTAFEHEEETSRDLTSPSSNGGVATAVWSPARPGLAIATELPAQDEYEVRIYDERHGRRLVAAIEIVSPANKDRPASKQAFIAKCVALLQKQVSVTIVDLVTIPGGNLYAELLAFLGQRDPALGEKPPATYTVACRAVQHESKPGARWQFESWLDVLKVGERLPTLPLWLAADIAIPLDLEESYEETCRALRIA